ncbi:unnamed protein product [Pleuronectes platessa]|uniref:Uncharacterized protein n=1 Tax=Pleuronectes platessa TaxID=8262 RepID=A0A9N7YP77_PLEPL|nr:unnamed protein product [Pleuronectes platessa]
MVVLLVVNQVTTGATDIAATPSLQRGVQKRVTRRVGETSDLLFTVHLFLFPSEPRMKRDFCFYGRVVMNL